MSRESREDFGVRALRAVTLSVGGLSFILLALWALGDWVYGEWELPAGYPVVAATSALAWVVALGSALLQRAALPALALALGPAFGVVWVLLND